MPHVTIRHATEYEYRRPVRLGTHRLMVRPRDSFDLRVRAATLYVTPPASRIRWAHDVFANTVCLLDWQDVQTAKLRIVSELELDHFPAPSDSTLDPAAAAFPFRYAASEMPDLAPFIARHGSDPEDTVGHWARTFVSNLRQPDGSVGTLALLAAMTAGIRAGFTYAMRDAEGTQPAAETLRLGTGACRDFALLMMEAVRSLGMASRFVSGYLYHSGSTALQGGGATHAWVAVYLPGSGWVEYDPTNGLIAGRNLIRVCSARSPEQAVPLSGTYEGAASDFVQLKVEVQAAAVPTPIKASTAQG